MKEIFIEAIGLAAPGLLKWQTALPILRGESAYVAQPLPTYAPTLLPANERRRATPTVRLAFQAAEDALTSTALSAAKLATVFTSSDADLNIIHRICSALAATPRLVSPTDFHNSVHNAATGYWSIAVGARAPSTSLSAYDGSFAAGLFEAYGYVLAEGLDTMLVAFDLPPPEPLYAKRPIAQPVGVALILTAERTAQSLAAMRCEQSRELEQALTDAELEALRLSNPAARALPVLKALAQARPARIALPLHENSTLVVALRTP